eukprot:scaffold53834_cov32-Tisochrysis_lutea.AAC.2
MAKACPHRAVERETRRRRRQSEHGAHKQLRMRFEQYTRRAEWQRHGRGSSGERKRAGESAWHDARELKVVISLELRPEVQHIVHRLHVEGLLNLGVWACNRVHEHQQGQYRLGWLGQPAGTSRVT